jgi:hypothetical protein
VRRVSKGKHCCTPFSRVRDCHRSVMVLLCHRGHHTHACDQQTRQDELQPPLSKPRAISFPLFTERALRFPLPPLPLSSLHCHPATMHHQSHRQGSHWKNASSLVLPTQPSDWSHSGLAAFYFFPTVHEQCCNHLSIRFVAIRCAPCALLP